MLHAMQVLLPLLLPLLLLCRRGCCRCRRCNGCRRPGPCPAWCLHGRWGRGTIVGSPEVGVAATLQRKLSKLRGQPLLVCCMLSGIIALMLHLLPVLLPVLLLVLALVLLVLLLRRLMLAMLLVGMVGAVGVVGLMLLLAAAAAHCPVAVCRTPAKLVVGVVPARPLLCVAAHASTSSIHGNMLCLVPRARLLQPAEGARVSRQLCSWVEPPAGGDRSPLGWRWAVSRWKKRIWEGQCATGLAGGGCQVLAPKPVPNMGRADAKF